MKVHDNGNLNLTWDQVVKIISRIKMNVNVNQLTESRVLVTPRLTFMRDEAYLIN